MQFAVLNTNVRRVRNVGGFVIGGRSIHEVPTLLAARRAAAAQNGGDGRVVFLIDEFFSGDSRMCASLGVSAGDPVEYVCTKQEPTTDGIDRLVAELRAASIREPAAIVGMGGGTTLDTAKAVANLLTNPGSARDYQGWDLVRNPAIYKIGVPTLSGTGAEASRTCVMINPATGLKLGMNSDHTVYDYVVMDPDLSRTAPRNQYFYSGMDAYIHCVESLEGHYRNAVGDALCRETLALCRKVFLSGDMMGHEERELLMVASYLGGCAIGMGYVGVIHPLSAGLSVVLGMHHCIANCVVMRAMNEFYPRAYAEFWEMADRQEVTIPAGVARDLSPAEYQALYDATIIHEKPLTNALGTDFRGILTLEKVTALFQAM